MKILEPPTPMSLELRNAIHSAQELIVWIAQHQDDIVIPAAERSSVPGILLDLVIEHHAGIVTLIHTRLYGSAFALLRPMFEGFVRAAWLRHCATDAQLEKFIRSDQLAVKLGAMVEALASLPEFSNSVLKGAAAQSLKAMHGFTHGGLNQVSPRTDGKTIEAHHDNAGIVEALQFSSSLALMALQQISQIAGMKLLYDEVAERKRDPLPPRSSLVEPPPGSTIIGPLHRLGTTWEYIPDS